MGAKTLRGTVVLLIGLSAALPARALAPACQPFVDAVVKQIGTPTHLYITETSAARGGAPRKSESIYSGGAIYVQVDGIWRRSPISVSDMQRQQQENLRNQKTASCRHLRDEAVGREAAAVYSEESDVEGTKTSAMVWISKSRGLPLRLEHDSDVGVKMGKSHSSVRYEYGDVKPPAGVK